MSTIMEDAPSPDSGAPDAGPARSHGLSLAEASRTWARIALLSFGGPAGQIAVMHRILVEEKKWIGEERFLHALNYCMLLPGPEAQQLATYIGWLLHRTKGGIIAGGLFVLPGLVSIMALSWLYAAFGNVGAVAAAFFGLKAAVLAVVIDAVRRIGSRALRNNAMRAVAAIAFLALFAFAIPFPIVIVAAGILGFLAARAGFRSFAAKGGGHGPSGGAIVHDSETLLGEEMPAHARPGLGWSLRVGIILLGLWLAPIAALFLLLGPDHVFTQVAIFFSKMAMVTFGGAYAVLAYVAQQAVDTFGWLQPGEMLDGLGMAETTPGPLIMVNQFVAFMGAFRAPTGMHPMLAGTLAGLLATWVTFLPCFLWIFLGAPFIERLRGNVALQAGLATITAAVVGVILNLAIWFGVHVLFAEVRPFAAGPIRIDLPVLTSINPWSTALALAAAVAILRFKVGILTTLGTACLAGIAIWLAS